MRLTLVYKLSLSATLLVLLSSTIVGYLFYTKTTSLLVEHTQQDIIVDIRKAGSHFQNLINILRDDVLFLANTAPVQGMWRGGQLRSQNNGNVLGYAQSIKRLQAIFSTMLASKQAYLKIRFLDKAGEELISIGRDENKIIIVEDNQLQNKAHRKYVKNTILLANGSVFLSEINLNREHGLVSVPHQEVLRSATPVYDHKNKYVVGIIVITADIGRELKKIQKNIQVSSRNIYITNDRGGYLIHPDVSKRYGFDLEKRYRIQEDFPSLAPLFIPGNMQTSFIQTPKSDNDKNVVNVNKIYFDTAQPDRFIIVGITELLSSIARKQSRVLNDVVLLALALALAVAFLAVFLSYRLTLPIRQMTQVMDDYTNERQSNINMPVEQNDEIGVLARSYDALMGQVKEAQLTQVEMTRNLESMVTDRTHELMVSEIRQRSIVENIVDGLVTITKLGIIESFNPAAEKIFGYCQEEVLGENIKMLMPEPYRKEHDGYLSDYHKTGIKKIIGIGQELEAQRKDGSIFPMELAISEVYVSDHKLFTGIIRDITERKQIEKMKDEFISTVSHELRTPLTSIRGSLGLLSSGVVGKLPTSAANMLDIAVNNTERLLFLINDILDIQKIESGQLDFNFEKLDVIEFLTNAVKDNAAYGKQYSVEFLLQYDLHDIFVYADKERLMQVMANLLSNAAKFSLKNSSVDVTVSRIEDVLRISVSDQGIGIPEEFQPKLFDKFTQSDSSDSRQKGGTGLGLSITKFIVERHDGNIGYTSKQGVGTRFYFDLNEFRD
ncbi:hypothetical protein MNBD_GAMMA22-2172 [hydrothermal vent metagenome]|uniref:histidine kinase n=1 Tax=hydrothermal vent metagenome TaxID=652676 RepID=A0A3B0ZL84_9ZZZZ